MPLYTQDYSPTNPPPDAGDPLALTAYNPVTWIKIGQAADFGQSISTGTTRVGYDDARLTYRGAAEFTVGAAYPDNLLYASASLYPHTRGTQTVWGVSFFTDAAFFEIQGKYTQNGQAFRLLVNGRRVSDQATMTVQPGAVAGGTANVRFDFGSSAPREILLELYDFPFNGVFIPTGASLWKVPAFADRTLILGDSVSAGSSQNLGTGIGTWVHRTAKLLGWGDVWNQALGGGGYLASSYPALMARATGSVAGSTGGLNDVGQYGLATGITQVIVFAGINDSSGSQATIQTNAGTLYQNLKAALPAASIYVIGAFASAGVPATGIVTTDETLRVAAAAAGIPFISPVTGKVYNARGTMISDQGPWITTTNQTAFISADGIHPNDYGHLYISRRIASAFRSLLADVSTVAPWAGGLHAALEDGAPSQDKAQNYINGPTTLGTLTPTVLTVSVARCWSYNCQFPIVVNRLRWYGIGATTTHQVAVYRQSDGVRVIGPLSLTTTADAWNSVAVPAVALAPNTPYIVALSTTATGTTAGLRTSGTPLLFPPLQASTPGGLALAVGDNRYWFGQFAVTSGALPATLPTLVRGSGWTAGLPLFFFDSNAAA